MPRLLLVDDEPTLLQLLRRYLERQGFDVDTAESAEMALSTFNLDPQRYDFVITDLTLPGLNGAELLEQIRSENPSGTRTHLKRISVRATTEGRQFLQKPFLPQMLADQIAKTLKR